ncbi:MAG: MalY/PatB family protein [Clostridia bacterium]
MANFDKHFDRLNTNSYKFDFANEFNMPDGLKPLWVADMDFPVAQEINFEIKKVAEKGIYGYSMTGDSYYNSLINWFLNRHDFLISREWIVECPGVVFALNMAVKAFTNEGDAVMIQRPVYYPFSNAINNNKRKLVNNALVYKDGKYSIDFADMEAKIISENVKLFLLCSPHNPVGRVWTKDELLNISDICLKHNVIVVSDEIHCDFVFSGKHTAFSTLNEASLLNSIICTAPSKTFNLAGLQVSNIVIANDKLRELFKKEVLCSGYELLNIFAITACDSAYRYGGKWLDELLTYLNKTYQELSEFVQKNMKKAKVIELQGTYLVWIDFADYGFTHAQLVNKIVNNAKIWLDDGAMFGTEGEGFMRINIASPRNEIMEAMQKICSALN